jgi:hypothetical protein
MVIPEEMDIDVTTDINRRLYQICDGPILLKHMHLGTEIISSCSSISWTKMWRVTGGARNILQNFVALSFAIFRSPSRRKFMFYNIFCVCVCECKKPFFLTQVYVDFMQSYESSVGIIYIKICFKY